MNQWLAFNISSTYAFNYNRTRGRDCGHFLSSSFNTELVITPKLMYLISTSTYAIVFSTFFLKEAVCFDI